MVTALRANRTVVTDVYEDLREMIAYDARKFARQYRRCPEECLARANLIFLESYHSYEPRLGRLEPRVRRLVWNRLIDWVRSEGSYGRRVTAETDYISSGERLPDPPANTRQFDRAGFWAELSADAKLVARLVLESPAEIRDAYPLLDIAAPGLDAVIGAINAPADLSAGTIRGLMAGLLASLGWGKKRIKQAFSEIGEALA